MRENRYRLTARPLRPVLAWLEGYRQACAVQAEAPDTTVICLSDSEGDIYEPLLEARPSWLQHCPAAQRPLVGRLLPLRRARLP